MAVKTTDYNMSVTGTIAGVPILAVLPAGHNAPAQFLDICLNGLTLDTSQDITIVSEDRTIGTDTVTVVTKAQVNASLVTADGMTLVVHYADLGAV